MELWSGLASGAALDGHGRQAFQRMGTAGKHHVFFITVTSFALACYITINTNVICTGGWYKGTINEDVFVLAVLKLASMQILCFHTGGKKIPPVEIVFLLSVSTSCVLVGFLQRAINIAKTG